MKSKEFDKLAKESLSTYRFGSCDSMHAEVLSGIGLSEERRTRGINKKNRIIVSKVGAMYFINYHCACILANGYNEQELNNIKWLFVNFIDVV